MPRSFAKKDEYELVPCERKHASVRVGHVQMPDVLARPLHDGRILAVAGKVIEINHELKRGFVDRFHQLQTLGRRVDDVGFRTTQRFDSDGDAARSRLRRDPPAEVDQLIERLTLRKAVGHPARAAAAEDERLHADTRQAIERLADVGHLLFAIDIRSGHLERGRQKQVGWPASADRRWRCAERLARSRRRRARRSLSWRV